VGQIDNSDPVKAEVDWRAGLTKYLGWVFAHTLPGLKDGHPKAAELADVDVAAIDEAIGGLGGALNSLGRAQDLLSTIDHVVRTVPLPGLSERLRAHKALWLDAVLGDNEEASRELDGLDPSRIRDRRLLEAFVAIRPPSDPFERVRLYERVLRAAAADTDKLEYLYTATTLAVELLLVGDKARCLTLLDEGLALVSHRSPSNSDAVAAFTIGRALALRGRLRESESDLHAALAWYRSVNLASILQAGKADTHQFFGNILGDLGQHGEAVAELDLALELGADPDTRLRLAEELIWNGDTDRAERELAAVDQARLSPSGVAEFLTNKATVGVLRKNEAIVRECVDGLRQLVIPEQYFREARDTACLNLLAVLDREGEAWTSRKQGLLLRVLRQIAAVCAYLELKPNFFGLGLNLNRVVDRLAERTDPP
jgi:hypothetical protein